MLVNYKNALSLPGTTKTALVLPENISFDEWQAVGDKIMQCTHSCMWWLGDWWAFGEHKYGERVSQAQESDYSFQTLMNAASVARSIETSRRREVLSFSHHKEVAALEPDAQDEFLSAAEEKDMSTRELRKIVRSYKTTLNTKAPPPLPANKYSVILADPPWQYEHMISESREIENQYPTLTLEEICELPVEGLAADDAMLFLWTTTPHLTQAIEVIPAWGFDYRSSMVWVKPSIGPGYYVRQRHEFLLIARKGEPKLPAGPDKPDSIIEAPRREHSQKPEIVHELIERAYPDGKYIELYCREKRIGWAAWGDEV